MERGMETIFDPALPPLCNSWIMLIIYFCIALNMMLSMDCYRTGTGPKLWGLGFLFITMGFRISV